MSAAARALLWSGTTLAVIGAVLTGCDGGNDSYFPLGAGWQYGYRTELKTEGSSTETQRFTATNLPPRDVGGATATPQLHQDGRILFYAADADGIRLAGFQKPGEDAATSISGQYILRYPLEAGTKWRAPGRTVLLTQRFLYSKALPINIGVDFDYEIEQTHVDVRVPAGHFSNCIKVTATGHTTVNTADNQRTLNVDIKSAAWYAPGIGLVKETRAETAGRERTGNASLVSELEYVKKPAWFD